jgi:hypothetical protein
MRQDTTHLAYLLQRRQDLSGRALTILNACLAAGWHYAGWDRARNKPRFVPTVVRGDYMRDWLRRQDGRRNPDVGQPRIPDPGFL